MALNATQNEYVDVQWMEDQLAATCTFEHTPGHPVDLTQVQQATAILISSRDFEDVQQHAGLEEYVMGLQRIAPYCSLDEKEAINAMHDCLRRHQQEYELQFAKQISKQPPSEPNEATIAEEEALKARRAIADLQLQLEMGDMPLSVWPTHEDDVVQAIAASEFLEKFPLLGLKLADDPMLNGAGRNLALKLLHEGGYLNEAAGKLFMQAYEQQQRREERGGKAF